MTCQCTFYSYLLLPMSSNRRLTARHRSRRDPQGRPRRRLKELGTLLLPRTSILPFPSSPLIFVIRTLMPSTPRCYGSMMTRRPQATSITTMMHRNTQVFPMVPRSTPVLPMARWWTCVTFSLRTQPTARPVPRLMPLLTLISTSSRRRWRRGSFYLRRGTWVGSGLPQTANTVGVLGRTTSRERGAYLCPSTVISLWMDVASAMWFPPRWDRISPLLCQRRCATWTGAPAICASRSFRPIISRMSAARSPLLSPTRALAHATSLCRLPSLERTWLARPRMCPSFRAGRRLPLVG